MPSNGTKLKANASVRQTRDRDGLEKEIERIKEQMRQKLRSEEGKRIYEKRGYTVEPVFGQLKWDGRKPSMDLRGVVKVRGEFSLMCLVHNVKKIVKKVLDGTVSLPGKYSKLIEEAMLGYREEQTIDFGRGRGVKSAVMVNKSGRRGGSLQGIMLKVPETIDGR